MLGHRLRRWPNSNPALVECTMFAGMISSKLRCRRSSIIEPALSQRAISAEWLPSPPAGLWIDVSVERDI